MGKAKREFRKDDIFDYMSWREFNYCANISLKHKYLYIETPKVACSTIKNSLMRLEIDDLPYDTKKIHVSIFESPLLKPYQLPPDLLSEVLFGDSFFRFSFVRNPYTRILSAFLEKILRNHPNTQNLREQLNLHPDEKGALATFEEFLHIIDATAATEHDRHWRPQHLLLLEGWLNMHFLGRFENFSDDWDIVASKISGQTAESLNKIQWHATYADEKLSEYYTHESRKLVSQIYSQDFIRYDYDTASCPIAE